MEKNDDNVKDVHCISNGDSRKKIKVIITGLSIAIVLIIAIVIVVNNVINTNEESDLLGRKSLSDGENKINYVDVSSFKVSDNAKYDSIVELQAEWEKNGYPDYIGNVYMYDSNKTVVSIIDSEYNEGKSKVLEQLKSVEHLGFDRAKYSINELKDVQAKLSESEEFKKVCKVLA